MDNFKIKGKVTIYEGKKEDGIILNEFDNLVLNLSKKGILNLWAGNAIGYGKINILAIGDGTTAVNADDAQLKNELFRKPITSSTIYGSNRIVIDTFIETTEANFTWKEIGLFADGTWDTLNSGKLLNRALINEAKNSGVAKTVSWEITLT